MWDKSIVGFSLIECRCSGRWPVFALCHLLVCVCVHMRVHTCVPSEIRKGVKFSRSS